MNEKEIIREIEKLNKRKGLLELRIGQTKHPDELYLELKMLTIDLALIEAKMNEVEAMISKRTGQ